MPTFNIYPNGDRIADASGGSYAGSPVRTVLTGVFDSTRQNLAAADIAEVVDIPAGTLVHQVILETEDVQATGTVSVGDGTDPNGYIAAGNVAAAGKVIGAGLLVVAGGTFYAAADTIDVLVDVGKVATTLKCKVHVICDIV